MTNNKCQQAKELAFTKKLWNLRMELAHSSPEAEELELPDVADALERAIDCLDKAIARLKNKHRENGATF